MRCARPSTTAVLPTPGSPISTGLFFWRRERICMIRSISVWRPTTGSSFPSPACFVKLRPNWSSSFELFAQQPEQDVLRADVVVLERPRLVLGEDDDLPCPFGEAFEQLRPSFLAGTVIVAQLAAAMPRGFTGSLLGYRHERCGPYPGFSASSAARDSGSSATGVPVILAALR